MWGAEDGESGGFRFNFGGDADAAAAKAPNPDVAARALDVDPKEGGHIAGVEVLASSVPEHSPTWKPETLELDPSTTVVKGAVTSADAANALSDADGSIAVTIRRREGQVRRRVQALGVFRRSRQASLKTRGRRRRRR
jgi:hypothetical protein